MDDETRRKIDAMTSEEQERRLDELNRTAGILRPFNTSSGTIPGPTELADLEEREYLKAKLGYSNADADRGESTQT